MDPVITSVLVPTLCVGGCGLASAVALGIADKFLSVPEDPRVQAVLAALPGANCGGCGFAGCADYASAIVLHGAEASLCAPAGSAGAAAIAQVMGQAPGAAAERKVALVLCCGDETEAVRRAHYNGITDCAAAHATAGGDKACAYGCLGYGSCARVCPVNAVRVEKGIAAIDKEACIACGKCVKVCPRKLVKLVPASAQIHVLCSSKDKGPAVKKVCGTGCIGCHMCAKKAGDAIVMDGSLAVVDYAKELKDTEIIAKCPGHCIRKA
ncbi:MAG: 4Fe-4S binding protein [Kiritimatiellaeota bacterium]|nr:4Fe-4S binding protein [Kiritimatiellota bacterium]